MRRSQIAAATLGTLLLAIPALADVPAPPPSAPTSGFRAEFLAQSASIEKKLVSLAEATPAETFAWRPAEGVRSIGEVYAHVAVGNYFLMSLLGIKPPDSIDLQSMETTLKEKERIIAAMKEPFAFANREIAKMSDADLDKAMSFFGKATTARGILMISLEHVSEHLGQSIAYARMNGIAPPWSARRE